MEEARRPREERIIFLKTLLCYAQLQAMDCRFRFPAWRLQPTRTMTSADGGGRSASRLQPVLMTGSNGGGRAGSHLRQLKPAWTTGADGGGCTVSRRRQLQPARTRGARAVASARGVARASCRRAQRTACERKVETGGVRSNRAGGLRLLPSRVPARVTATMVEHSDLESDTPQVPSAAASGPCLPANHVRRKLPQCIKAPGAFVSIGWHYPTLSRFLISSKQ